MKHPLTRWASPPLRRLLPALALLLALGRPAPAAPAPPAGTPAAQPLAAALNSDGTLRAGLHGSFDPTGYVLGHDAATGRPAFRLARPVGAARVAKTAGALGAGDDKWQDGFGVPGTNGLVEATAVAANGDVYVGGDFTAVGTTPARGVARWNATTGTWSPLGTGISSRVFALAVAGADVYAGGLFATAGGAAANYVARWNATTGTWSPLGAGLNGSVFALAVAGAEVYVGGNFTQAGGVPASNMARWNATTGTWSPLGAGVNGQVDALAVAGADVYVGGDFTQAGGAPASRVAKWNPTTGTWSPLGAGVSGSFNTVYALAVAGAEVYVGGDFTSAGGAAVSRVAKWNPTTGTWSPMGTGPNGTVRALAVAGTDVYAGGRFAQVGGAAVSNVTRLNPATGTWSLLGTGTSGSSNTVYALAVAGANVYAGGSFAQAGGAAVSNVARWNAPASTWSPLGIGLNGPVAALAVAGADVYVGGNFTQVGGAAASRVAKWNATASAWSPLGAGVNGNVLAVAVAGADVYVGGLFSQAGGVAASNVARWNNTTSTWSPLGAGLSGSAGAGTSGAVQALAVAGADVYVGGSFSQAGGAAARGVARWNATASTWSPLGAGVNGSSNTVYALAVAGADVYVGGDFDQAGGAPASQVARWNATAGTWSPLGTGLSNGVRALAVAGTDVYVSGYFNQAGGAPASFVARWNPTTGTWSPLGVGLIGHVDALAVAGADVYAGGFFTQAGRAAANYVAKWNATTGTWSPLGTGLNNTVQALAAVGSKLYAGGLFTTVGDGSKVTAFFGIYDPARPNATAVGLSAAQVALYPNPAPRAGTGVRVALPVAAGQRATATILDALGRVVRPALALALAAAAGQATGTLPTAGLPAGVYTVRLSITGAGSVSKRLVVE